MLWDPHFTDEEAEAKENFGFRTHPQSQLESRGKALIPGWSLDNFWKWTDALRWDGRMDTKVSWAQNSFQGNGLFCPELSYARQHPRKIFFAALDLRLRNNSDAVFWSTSHCHHTATTFPPVYCWWIGVGLSFCISCSQPVRGGVGVHTWVWQQCGHVFCVSLPSMASDGPYNSRKTQRCVVISVSVNWGPCVALRLSRQRRTLESHGSHPSILQMRCKHSGDSFCWALTVDETVCC